MESFESQWVPGPHGGTSDCYVSETDDRVFLKLFRSGIPDDVVEREYLTAKHIHDAAKIPVPGVLNLFDANGRKGIIYERVFGKTFAEMLKERSVSPSDCAESFGKEALKLHGTDMDLTWLPPFRDEVSESIDFVYASRGARRLLHRVLARICEASGKDVFLHGDLHPGNIMVTEDGFCWIDIGYACRGPALFDLASSDAMLNFALTSLFTESPFGLTVKEMKQLYTRFLETYFRTTDKKEIREWQKKIRLCSALYVCNIIRKENWRGAAKFGLKIIVWITGILYKEQI